MHIRTKFDGGKQINRSQRGSWEGRCVGAGLRLNGGPQWGLQCWERATSLQPNTIFATHASSVAKVVENDRKRKSSLPAKQQRKKSRQTSADNSLSSRRSYSRYDGGPNATDVIQDIPPQHLQDMMITFYRTKVVVSEAHSKQLQLITMQHQYDDMACGIWKAERRTRITSSMAGTIAKRRATTQVSSTVRSMLYSKFNGNEATRWGLSQEKATASQYLKLKQQNGSPAISINTECGLVISVSHPWLAATPDGFVNDPQGTPAQGLVEFKNPHSCRHLTLIDAVQNKKLTFLSCHSTGVLALKHSDKYYYQLQVAMYCTNKKWCDFVVRTSVDIHVERVQYDEVFFNSCLHKLKEFYFNSILPELTSPMKPIREPTWISNIEEWKNRIDPL